MEFLDKEREPQPLATVFVIDVSQSVRQLHHANVPLFVLCFACD